ncbi:hypothetical protein I6N95_23460 [Vagococcus sp. BWB3-3]|uniref:Uncharacterized protein n=1 Tax=Vagococcus allomyrinae TaxID=2794353 RepID=A0A940PI20_9ENTE|nr:hypothetical protein [Vagococcus allomyrinae]MBP1043971.1 hypothetical protein [Vagococcus allomyrinae]
MLQHVIHMKSRMFKEVQKRNAKTTVLLKEATIDYAKLMQLTIFCKQQGIPTEFFEPASHRFMEYWNRFFPNFILHELYYEFSEAGDFALSVNFQRGQRRIKGETNDLKDKAAELLAVCLREIDISKANHLDEKLTARQKQIDELELEYKTYREISEQDLQEKDHYLDRLQAKYKQMDKNLSSRQQRINDLEKDHEHFRQQAARNIQAKSNQLDILQGRYEQLNEELAARQQRINNIGRDHEIFRKQAELDVENKNEQLDILQTRYEKLEDELSFYEEKIKKIEQDHHLYRERTEEDIVRKNNEVKDLQEKLTTKQHLLDESIPNFERYKQQSEEQLIAKNEELAELERKHEEISLELISRQQKVSKLERNLEVFKELAESELNKKNQELIELQTKYGLMTNELTERQEQISSIEQEQKKFTAQAEHDIKQKDEQLGGLREKFAKISDDLSKQYQIVELEADHEAFRKQVRQDILMKKEQLDDLHDKYNQMDQELVSRQVKIDTLEADYASFRSQVEQDIQLKNEQLEKLQQLYDEMRKGKHQEVKPKKVSDDKLIVDLHKAKQQQPSVEAEIETSLSEELTSGTNSDQESLNKTLSLKKLAEVTKKVATPVRSVEENSEEAKGKVLVLQQVLEELDERVERQGEDIGEKPQEVLKQTAQVVEEAKEGDTELVAPLETGDDHHTYNMPAIEITQEFRQIKRFSDVHMDADFRHLGERDKNQPKVSPKIESMRERLKASVNEQIANVERPADIATKSTLLPNTGNVVTSSKYQLELKIRELFKQSQKPEHEKRIKVQRDDYYSYITAIDFLDYQWSQAMLHKEGRNNDEFLNWVQQFIDHLPNFKEDLDFNVRKPMFNKANYVTNLETLSMLQAYALLNQFLELYCEEIESK